MAAMGTDILNHAGYVLQPGGCLGVFDFLALAVLKRCEVHVHLGEGSTDLRAVFAPGIAPLPAGSARCDILGMWYENGSFEFPRAELLLPNVNHWMIAEYSALASSSRGDTASDNISRALATRCLTPRPTSLSECGMACWAFALHMPRNADSFARLRAELSAFLHDHHADPVWHQIWQALG